MILRGVIEHIFGGALSFRGYARLEDLANLSYSPTDEYQREADVSRSQEILKFLQTSEFRFFPEVILGLTFKDSLAITKILQGEKTNFSDNISFNTYAKDFKDYENSDKFDSPVLRRISLDFKDNQKCLTRIDGNHRLTAIDIFLQTSKDVGTFGNLLDYYIPFNIILQNDNTEALKNEIAYFHLINSKSKPLTSEENLKSIIDAKSFTSEEISTILETDGELIREILDKTNNYTVYPSLEEKIIDCKRTFTLELTSLLLNNGLGKEEISSKIIGSFAECNTLIEKHGIIYNRNIIVALAYQLIVGNDYVKFLSWVKANRIDTIENISSENLINLFAEYQKIELKVFIAMPYFEGNAQIVREYNQIYKNAIDSIAKEYNVNISNYKIMENTGGTGDQIQDILDKIKNSDIVFCDISDNNANVLYETGWARALNKRVILVREKTSEKPKSDYLNDTYHEYDNKARNTTLTEVIKINLIDDLKNHFNLIQ